MSQQKSLEKVWKAYQKSLLAFIGSKVATLEDAEDILNDVFEALINKVKNHDTPDNTAAWLYAVARNKIIDYYRTKKSFDGLSEDLASESSNASAVTQLSHCLMPMIKSLPENYQQPLILSEIEGRKYKDLARELNLSLSAVKSRIRRGRQKLYNRLLFCCTIERDMGGNVMDFQPKNKNACSACGG